MTVLAVLFGLAIGMSLGALSGGGSILTVPVLVYALGESPHAATGTSLLVVGIAAVAGLVSHARSGHVAWAQGIAFGLLGGAGSVAGTGLSKAVDQHVLLTAFAALMLLAATLMLVRQQFSKATGAGLTNSTAKADCPRWSRCWQLKALRILAAATVVGLLTGFFGVGGGFIAVPALTLALGFDMAGCGRHQPARHCHQRRHRPCRPHRHESRSRCRRPVHPGGHRRHRRRRPGRRSGARRPADPGVRRAVDRRRRLRRQPVRPPSPQLTDQGTTPSQHPFAVPVGV